MKQKIIHITAWLALFFWALGLLFKVFHLPGAALGLIFGTFLSQVFFIPFFFFLKNDRLETHYSNKWIRIFQGTSFFVLGFSPIFSLQHWPGATALFFLGLIAIIILTITLFFTKQPHFRKPHYLALLVILVLNFVVIRVANQIGANQRADNLSPQFYRTLDKRIALQKEYESLIHSTGKTNNAQADSVFKVIFEIQKELYRVADQLPEGIDDSFWLNTLPISSHNFELTTHIMIGP